MQAFRYALDVTPSQERRLLRHAGAARAAYNWGLAHVRANLAQREAERTYGLPEDALTPATSWSMYALRKEWNKAKHRVAPWWAECSKEAYASGLTQLAAALANWSRSRHGDRAGRRVEFPRFKAKRRAVPSVRFTTGAIRLEDGRHHVTLPVVGTLRTHESTRKLHRRIAAGTGRILSATVRRETGRWFVSFTCEVDRAVRVPARPAAIIGVDLGVKKLAVFSDDRPDVENTRRLKKSARRLRIASRRASRRQGPDRRAGRAPSARWRRADASRARLHRRTAFQRKDAIHKLTTSLAREYGVIVIEDLNVAGMLRNRRLSAALSDAAFGEIRRQLAYKTAWNGGRLIIADRWYPSSKTCSACGVVKPKLPLHIRTFTCDSCGLVLDRDRNAALNLAALAKHVIAGSGPEMENGRGAAVRPGRAGQVAEKRQSRTGRRRIRRESSPDNGRIADIEK
ncbi:IS607 family element RNA-guided endonuclease TnpB [Actinomadura atramentaria]|uniref:IS607 family element RNA-guided endonuclease TnpB n=1 Tax=Actinomadura atramentaria TaxID=1990 RepID=UPI001F0B575E|nr:IS607 family element RNA-guided endonuclease TnpB [Actinomadura atramentaria]